jgi:hypothetical protein
MFRGVMIAAILAAALAVSTGAEMEQVGEEGKFAEVSYTFPRPGSDKTPVAKVSFVTKTAGYVCIVGYYK